MSRRDIFQLAFFARLACREADGRALRWHSVSFRFISLRFMKSCISVFPASLSFFVQRCGVLGLGRQQQASILKADASCSSFPFWGSRAASCALICDDLRFRASPREKGVV